jgi:hypothetical protein
MTYSQFENKYQYLLNDLYRFSYLYYYWANDTLGNEMATPFNMFSYFGEMVPIIDPDLTPVILGFGGLLFIIGISVYLAMREERKQMKNTTQS